VITIKCYTCTDTGFIRLTEKDGSGLECEQYYLCNCGKEYAGYSHVMKKIEAIPFWESIVNDLIKDNHKIFDNPEYVTRSIKDILRAFGTDLPIDKSEAG